MRCFLRVLPMFALALIAACAVSAEADTISYFDLNATLYGGPVATGDFVVDATNGTLTSGEVTISYEGSQLTLPTVESQFLSDGNFEAVLGSAASPGNTFELVFPVSSLMGYSGGSIASTSSGSGDVSILDYSGYADTVSSGELTLLSSTDIGAGSDTAAQTPESGTLLLVMTGLIMGMFVVRRRKAEEGTLQALRSGSNGTRSKPLEA